MSSAQELALALLSLGTLIAVGFCVQRIRHRVKGNYNAGNWTYTITLPTYLDFTLYLALVLSIVAYVVIGVFNVLWIWAILGKINGR